jgi:hypothetical protein
MYIEYFSANVLRWHSACNPSVHGKRHGILRTPQFDEYFVSLVRRIVFRCVFPGLWWSRWFGSITAPSPRCDHQPHAGFGFGAAR